MRFVYEGVFLACVLIICYKAWRSPRLDAWLRRTFGRPAPTSPDGLAAEASRLRKDEQKLEQNAEQAVKDIRRNYKKIRKLDI